MRYGSGDGDAPGNTAGARAARGSRSPRAAALQPAMLLLAGSVNHISLLNAVFQKGEIMICVLDIYLALPDAFPKPLLEGE